ncbi:hypothetical protein GGS23DRAFT_594815 [Durotheca rogersii]|uniref:uncharacterized protein n=1 Tax=Durotheca rogersii TaxID=419775 RepID=UPI0022212919|nr:uncharacterized protein GGS23DRAFT_594815 [Durotheca rogersii]KAI5865274.1 hypothetical protein GGS23DRAFT_594815 [Durotheca rogersii]
MRIADDGNYAIYALLDPELTARALTATPARAYQKIGTPDPGPAYHDDECAVYTTQDIAKTWECARNLELAAA